VNDVPVVDAPAIDALPKLRWQGPALPASYEDSTLTISATAGNDWFNDPQSDSRDHSASALLFAQAGDFMLSAKVTVEFHDTFDAGVLCLRISENYWAKLCFEFSPQRQPMVVSVVTRGISDDANAVVIDGNTVHLRISRMGPAYAFHYSNDGSYWNFVRCFRLADDGTAADAGFMVQAPSAIDCTGSFTDIVLSPTTLADLRSGV
jgi:regulation of enolase protein 1 (concanavalin A-like superfamily)